MRASTRPPMINTSEMTISAVMGVFRGRLMNLV
jgi:hypothetical protein